MKTTITDSYLEKLFQGKAISGKPKYSSDIVVKFKRTVQKLQLASNIKDLKEQRGLNFEALKGEYKGYFSVRVDRSYRLILTYKKGKKSNFADCITVIDLTNHYQ